MPTRIAILRLLLTEEQKINIRTASGGTDVTEALVAGPVDQAERLENEIIGDEARKIADEIWTANQTFVEKLGQKPRVKTEFEEHTGHELFPDIPTVAILR
jgi:hypothetical protein